MGEGVQTHYEILGIGRQASPELVRQAYRRQAQKYHPDRQPGNGEAQQCMARINQAYAVLSDPDGRSAYNRWCDAREGLVAAERAVAQAAPTGFSATWPWFLLALTLAVILVSVGTVLYKEFVPAQVPTLAPLRGVAPSGAQRPPSQAGNTRSPAEAAPTAAPAAR